MVEAAINTTGLIDKKLNDACSYLYWANIEGFAIKFEQSDEMKRMCLASGDSKQYALTYGLEELYRMTSYELLHKLLAFTAIS